MRTQRAADRWRQEVDGRRPFAAELQKLQQLLIQCTLLQHDVVVLRKRMLAGVAKLEAAGAGAKIADTKKALKEAQTLEPAMLAGMTEHKEFIDQMWRVAKPTPEMFAQLQQIVASLESMVTATQADEERMQKYLTDNASIA